MKRILTILGAVSLCLSASAQNDSARLDAGGIVLKRAFTQHVSIKGAYLEKMPFSNLSDAINVWIGGVFTTSASLIYVVDGNIISDVNAYSVHDIEEVVFLQHAGALTATAGDQREMVLITTRKNKSRLNMRGAAQTFLSHRSGSTTNLYHQYYAGVDANYDKFSVGVSANYLRDVNPTARVDGKHVITPDNMNRWRFNGDFSWRPDEKNTVEVHIGYVPQTIDSALNFDGVDNQTVDTKLHVHELDRQFNTWGRWRGEWASGLRNDLQVGYLNFTQRQTVDYLVQYISSTDHIVNTDSSNLHTHQIFVRDRLSYAIRAGGWTIEPAFNVSYNYVKEDYSDAQYTTTVYASQGNIPGVSYSKIGTNGYGKHWMLTPTMDIGYKQVFNIQGGLTSDQAVGYTVRPGSRTPNTVGFGSIAIDLLKLDGGMRHNSLKLFGSYAQRGVFGLSNFYLNDLDGANPSLRYFFNTSTQPGFVLTTETAHNGSNVEIPVTEPMPKYWVWQTGAQWIASQGRLDINYNLQRRNFSSVYEISNGGNLPDAFYLLEWKSTTHRLGVSYRIFERGDLSWQSGVNVARLDIKGHLLPTPGFFQDIHNKPSYSGGWVNRVQYRKLSLGLDVLYHYGDVIYVDDGINNYTVKKEDFALLQNIYIGYKLSLPKGMGLEVYIDSRGLARTGVRTSYLENPRRYYGIGANLGL